MQVATRHEDGQDRKGSAAVGLGAGAVKGGERTPAGAAGVRGKGEP